MKIVISTIEGFVKKALRGLDRCLRTDLYRKATRFKDAWYRSSFINALRRGIYPVVITLRYKIGLFKNAQMKLHLGCGARHIEGYVNIDFRKTSATDLVCDIRKLPYTDKSVELIETYHVIEHLPRHDLPITLKEWYRVLTAGGKLIIECPNFDEIAKQYVQGNKKRIDNIFGLQRFPGDTHLFGYDYDSLKKILEQEGFGNIQKGEPRDYHIKDEPCLRVECVKTQ
jgi:predicted SAM-dependent methyltransferase